MFVKARYRSAYVICMVGLAVLMVLIAGCSRQSVGQASTMVTPQSQEKPLKLLNFKGFSGLFLCLCEK